jgi:hypothetical protein
VVAWASEPAQARTVISDAASGWTRHLQTDVSSGRIADSGLEFDYRYETECSVREGDPLSATVRTTIDSGWRRDDWRCSITVKCTMTSSDSAYVHDTELIARHGDEVVCRRSFHHEQARDLA